MAGVYKFTAQHLAASGLIVIGLLTPLTALASSTVIDGPGFKVEKRQGWFGRKSSSYQDALGNKVEKNTGFFGRTSTHTKVLGTETIKNGNNVVVNGPNGQPLVSKKKTWFHGDETHVDGNGIVDSFKKLFQ